MKYQPKQIEAAYALCLSLFNDGKTITYADMGKRFGYHHRSPLLWGLLEEVNVLAKQRGLPYAISGVVVDTTGKPGIGYAYCAFRLGLLPLPRAA